MRSKAQKKVSRDYYKRFRLYGKVFMKKLKSPKQLAPGMIVKLEGIKAHKIETTYGIVLMNANSVLKIYRKDFETGIRVETYGNMFKRKDPFNYLSIVSVMPLKGITYGLEMLRALQDGRDILKINDTIWIDTTTTTISFNNRNYILSNESARELTRLLKDMTYE